jgi:FMN phosphatase YigB (HAD superfamily)
MKAYIPPSDSTQTYESKVLKWDSARKSFNLELWQLDEKLKAIKDILPEIQVLSLDVFDTLLFRACRHPHDVFSETGRRACQQGLLPIGVAPEEYKAVRVFALDRAYRSSAREPHLEDILSLIPASLGDRHRLLELELKTEEELCYLNPSVFSLVLHCRRRGMDVVLLSDTYLGKRNVARLLHRAGFPEGLVKHLLVSVDEGLGKFNGALFGRLFDLYPSVDPGRVLHIGDNYRSDVELAREKGLRTCHYNVVGDDPTGVLDYEEVRHGEMLTELRSLRSLGMRLCADLPEEDRPWFQLGAGVLGPFLSAFCDWVIDVAVAEEAEAIAPFMREAATLAPMIRRAVEDRGLSIDVIPLFVSREAAVLAGQENVDEALIQSFFQNREYFRVRDLFRSLDFGNQLGRFAPFAETYLGEAWGVEVAPGRTLLEELADWLREPDTRRAIEAAIRKRRQNLVAYLQQSLAGRSPVITVDLGFYGQIQRAIDAALGMAGSPYRLIHLIGFGRENFGELLGLGTDIRAFAGSAGTYLDLIKTIHRSAPIVEQLLMGRQGSTLGYVRVDGRMKPLLDTDPIGNREHRQKELVQLGIKRFQELWLMFRRAKPSLAARVQYDKSGWCRLIHRLVDLPTPREARLLGDLHNDCNFGSIKVVRICPPEEEEQVRKIGAYDYYRFMRHSCAAVWPQGCITRVDPGAILSHFAGHSSTGYFEKMLQLSQRLLREGVEEVAMYGAGEVGRSFVRAARVSGLKILCAVDRNQKLWGTHLEGVEVVSLDEAVRRNPGAYVVTSFAFAREIRQAILARYRGCAFVPRVFLPE